MKIPLVSDGLKIIHNSITFKREQTISLFTTYFDLQLPKSTFHYIFCYPDLFGYQIDIKSNSMNVNNKGHQHYM
jgi:hypothetical protein